MKELLEQGLKKREIARIFNCSEQTIGQRLKKYKNNKEN
jgi:DNA invertase Pin-like site-specific DNA recombinase